MVGWSLLDRRWRGFVRAEAVPTQQLRTAFSRSRKAPSSRASMRLTIANVGVVAFSHRSLALQTGVGVGPGRPAPDRRAAALVMCRIEPLMRGVHVLALLILVVPLLAGTCSFSSSSGDTKVHVRVGDCESQEHPEPCTHAREKMAAALRTHESSAFVVRRQMTPRAAAPAVPEPSSWLLFAVGAAVVSRSRRPATGR